MTCSRFAGPIFAGKFQLSGMWKDHEEIEVFGGAVLRAAQTCHNSHCEITGHLPTYAISADKGSLSRNSMARGMHLGTHRDDLQKPEVF